MKYFILIIAIVISYSYLARADENTYSSRLNDAAASQVNGLLGTLSGKDREDARKRDLYEAYMYTPNRIEKNVEKNVIEEQYVQFRNEHHIPNYIGDEKAKKILKNSNEEIKKEVVKVVETEKLLQETFQKYYDNKQKLGAERDSKMDPKDLVGREAKMDDRIDVIGRATASILNDSMQKLQTTNERSSVDYLASGGRAIPKLELDREKDLLNLQSHVIERVQKELLLVLTHAINNYYQRTEKETAHHEIENKKQLMTFVNVEDKSESMQRVTHKTGSGGNAAPGGNVAVSNSNKTSSAVQGGATHDPISGRAYPHPQSPGLPPPGAASAWQNSGASSSVGSSSSQAYPNPQSPGPPPPGAGENGGGRDCSQGGC